MLKHRRGTNECRHMGILTGYDPQEQPRDSHGFSSSSASLILPIALGASGGLLLVLVPLVLFLLFWKRRHSSGRTQVAKTASNARTMNAYFAKGKASEEEDEQDYENVETLTGNDYEEEIGDEDSGSEADYVNYREPTENKYSEDENIYQNS